MLGVEGNVGDPEVPAAKKGPEDELMCRMFAGFEIFQSQLISRTNMDVDKTIA